MEANQQNSRPPVGVIILNWNGAELLRRFLPSVVRFTPPSVGQVIVADNGSNDDSVELLQREFPEVELIRFDKNYGFAEGYNKALAATGYEYTVLLNSDVEVKDDWLTPLFRYIDSHPHVGAVQPKIMSLNNPEEYEYAGACGGYIDRYGYPYCRGRIFGTVEKDGGQYDSVADDIFWTSGAAMLVRTKVYMEAGGLDSRFFAHMEEIDLCWRMQLAGYTLAAIPQARVYHLGGGSLPASNPRKTYLNFRNSLLMLHKNLPDGTRSKMLFKRRMLDTIAWCRFMATLDFGNANAILKAHKDFRRMRKGYVVHPRMDLLNKKPLRPNILVEYYAKGHTRFSEL